MPIYQAIVEMRVHVDCPGCESKIKKALSKLEGVDSVEIDMNMQKVTVTGWVDQRKVMKVVRKTGRLAELWPFPYNPEYNNYYNWYNYYDDLGNNTNNYDRQGYSGHKHGYYQQPPSFFSDDDATSCSIM